MHNCLHVAPLKICMAIQNVTCLLRCCCHCCSIPPTASLCLHPLFGFNELASTEECHWMPFFSSWGTSVSHLCYKCSSMSDPFCQTAPLLPAVTQQQHVVEYWQEGSTFTAIPPTSAFEVMGQYGRVGVSPSVMFKNTFIFNFHYPAVYLVGDLRHERKAAVSSRSQNPG